MGRVAADLVTPVANMLIAALAAGGLAGDEPRQQDPAGASGTLGDRLCAPIEPGAGVWPHGVDRAPVRAGRRRDAAGVGGVADRDHRRGPGDLGPDGVGPGGVSRAGRSRVRGRGRGHLRARGVAVGPKFGGSAAAARALQRERHADHRQRRDLRSGAVQRSLAAGAEGHDVGSGAASAGRTPARRQAGGRGARGPALPASGRVCVRRRPRDGAGSGRGDPDRGPRSLRGVHRDGVGLRRGGGVRRATLSAARVRRSLGGRDSLGPVDARARPGHPRESGLRGGVRIRSLSLAAHAHARWHDPDHADQAAVARVGGADPRSPPRLHQLGDVSRQPRARGRALHPSRGAAGTRGPGALSGDRALWGLWSRDDDDVSGRQAGL